MSRLFIFVVSFLLLVSRVEAQNNSAEAKAAYLLAEEEFNAGKYETTVNYLDQATQKLGAANAKILYLKIMAEKELVKKNPSYFAKLKESISAFEKAPDAASFNEEKYLEVVKLKLKLSQSSAEQFVEEAEGDMTDLFKKYTVEGFYLGAKLDEMKTSRPEFFAKARKTLSKDSSEEAYATSDPAEHNKSLTITFKKGKVIRISGFFMTNNEDKNFSKGNALHQKYIGMFSGTPEVKKETKSLIKGVTTTTTDHRWTEGKISVFITYDNSVFGLGFGSKAYQSSCGLFVQLN